MLRDKIFFSLPTPNPSQRKSSPVFVMGCHRSGTNLLYDMLLSSGGFALYRGYLPIYKVLVPRFGRIVLQLAQLFRGGPLGSRSCMSALVPSARDTAGNSFAGLLGVRGAAVVVHQSGASGAGWRRSPSRPTKLPDSE